MHLVAEAKGQDGSGHTLSLDGQPESGTIALHHALLLSGGGSHTLFLNYILVADKNNNKLLIHVDCSSCAVRHSSLSIVFPVASYLL